MTQVSNIKQILNNTKFRRVILKMIAVCVIFSFCVYVSVVVVLLGTVHKIHGFWYTSLCSGSTNAE